MMSVPINYWAVLVAAVVNMVLGSLWFGPVFGKKWAASAGMKMPSQMTAAEKKAMNFSYFMMFVGSLLMALILARAIFLSSAYLLAGGAAVGMWTGLIAWIGFVAPVTWGVVLWDKKTWTYWAYTYLYYLLGFVVMGAILGAWM